jgi:hypothetical protein
VSKLQRFLTQHKKVLSINPMHHEKVLSINPSASTHFHVPLQDLHTPQCQMDQPSYCTAPQIWHQWLDVCQACCHWVSNAPLSSGQRICAWVSLSHTLHAPDALLVREMHAPHAAIASSVCTTCASASSPSSSLSTRHASPRAISNPIQNRFLTGSLGYKLVQPVLQPSSLG